MEGHRESFPNDGKAHKLPDQAPRPNSTRCKSLRDSPEEAINGPAQSLSSVQGIADQSLREGLQRPTTHLKTNDLTQVSQGRCILGQVVGGEFIRATVEGGVLQVAASGEAIEGTIACQQPSVSVDHEDCAQCGNDASKVCRESRSIEEPVDIRCAQMARELRRLRHQKGDQRCNQPDAIRLIPTELEAFVCTAGPAEGANQGQAGLRCASAPAILGL